MGTIGAGVWLTPVLTRLGVSFFQQPLTQQSERASVISLLIAGAGLVVSLLTLVVAALQFRQGSRPGRLPSPQVYREQQALDRLRVYLSRQASLPRMGDPATRALALRVHPAIDLPPSTAAAQPADSLAQPLAAGWWWPPRRWLQRAQQPPTLDPDLPVFIDRDQGQRLRAWLEAASETGGFLVLIGDSSVGKTRLLYETARQVLADFRVLAPDLGDGDLVNQLAAASFPLPRLLVWLDELQRFLDGPYLTPESTPITAATVRRLLEAPTPVVLVGTLWPEHATELRASDPQPTGQLRPRHPHAVDILDDRRVHEVVLRTFSEMERQAAARLAATDPRLATALADRDYNLTEVLAGARELVRRYERATHEQQAVVHAAVDARRLGIQAPLSARLLCAAARGYMTEVHPDDAWFGPVLAELTSNRRPQDRATAPLLVIPSPDRSRVLGYTVADYLLQRLARQRRALRLPAITWQAFSAHTDDHDDMARLADSAYNRLLHGYATPLYRRLADAGDGRGAVRLAKLLAEQGRVDELRARADADDYDYDAARALVELLVKEGRVDELRARADTRSWKTAWSEDAVFELVELLVKEGRVDELRARADAGDADAAERLAELLVKRGRVDDAIELLRARADASVGRAAGRLAELLAKEGRIDELRTRADAGDRYAGWQLAKLLVEQGREDELRTRANADDWRSAGWPAARGLVKLLAKEGRIDELRTRADAGDWLATQQLPELLAEQGRVDELRTRADAGNWYAARGLVELLAKEGRVDELRTRADAGDEDAAARLVELLAKGGRVDDAIELLRARADAGDESAAGRLAELLAEQGRTDELRTEVDAGTPTARDQLIALLTKRGNTDQAEQLQRWGLNPDGSIATAGDVAAGDKRSKPGLSSSYDDTMAPPVPLDPGAPPGTGLS